MTTIKAHFDGKTLVPDEPITLPMNEPLTLHIEVTQSQASGAEEKLRIFDELVESAEADRAPNVDWSRESIYSGTLDDPR